MANSLREIWNGVRSHPFVVFTSMRTLPPVCIETGNIVACAIPVFFRNPADLPRQVLPPRCSQRVTLVLQDALLPGLAKGAVAFIPRGHVEFLGDVEHLLELVRRRLARKVGVDGWIAFYDLQGQRVA